MTLVAIAIGPLCVGGGSVESASDWLPVLRGNPMAINSCMIAATMKQRRLSSLGPSRQLQNEGCDLHKMHLQARLLNTKLG
jgi:hypothetical protein